MSKPSWLDQHHQGEQLIRDACQSARDLSRRLGAVGFDALSTELLFLAETLQESHDLVRRSIDQKIDADYQQAWQSSANLFKAAIAGVEMAKYKEQTNADQD